LRRKSRIFLMIFWCLLQCLFGLSVAGGDRFVAIDRAENEPQVNGAQMAGRDRLGAAPSSIFSMTVQSGIFKQTPWPPMHVAGIRLWDTYTYWGMLEPSKGKYNWPALDRWLDLAHSHGADVLYTFGVTPTWASANPGAKCDYNSGGCYPPQNMQDWDDFVKALATHAAGRIKYWELWNEANQHEYWSGGVPALVTMAQHAYNIIKVINPSAIIFTPSSVGGATDTSTFLDEFLAAGGGQFVDGVAFHGYGNTIPSSPEEVNRIVDAVHAVMAKRGISSLPLWDTESSWGPAKQLPNEDDRVAFVARHYLLQWSKGVQRDYWYAWNDNDYGTLWDDSSHNIRRAGVAYRELVAWLTGAQMTTPCAISPDSTWTCGFRLQGGAPAQVVWNSSVSGASTLQFLPASNYVQYKSLDGSVRPISGGNIQIGNKPVLLLTTTSTLTTGHGSRSKPSPK